jgi:hypothetical protein
MTTLTCTESECVLQNVGEGSVLCNWRRVCNLQLENTVGTYDLVNACYIFVMSERERNMSGGKVRKLFEDFVVFNSMNQYFH